MRFLFTLANGSKLAVLAILACLFPFSAEADAFKCKSGTSVVYQSTPCETPETTLKRVNDELSPESARRGQETLEKLRSTTRRQSGSGNNTSIYHQSIDWRAIDWHAINAPYSAVNSVPALAQYLIRPAKNDYEKARAIFSWIVENIKYDFQAYASGARINMSAEAVLKRRTAVCAGYARLFSELAKAADLKVEVIIGVAKGYGYAESGNLGSHAWNAVQVDGKWLLIDPTWAAGYIDEDKTFVKKLQPFYFLTPPEQFIYTHFPEKPKWQLLATPITRDEFVQKIYVRPILFEMGIEFVSHEKNKIYFDDDVAIDLDVMPDTMLIAEVVNSGKKLARKHAHVTKNGTRARVHFSAPNPGHFDLRVYAKRQSETGPYQLAFEYALVAASGARK